MRLPIQKSALIILLALTSSRLLASPDSTNAPAPLAPGPGDGHIAYVTARLLEHYHYSRQPLDAEMSKKFFDGYLAMLDPRRENFLQSDVDEFAHYRTNLDPYTNGETDADLTPAFQIYDRYLERLAGAQHIRAGAAERRTSSSLPADDRLQIDRRHAPYPKDLDEAKQLWREQVRFQYFQEKLGRELVGDQ